MYNKLIFLLIGLSLILSACKGGDSNGTVAAVEGYINALASKDQASLVSLSCAEWESDAIVELDSFQLVTVTVDGLACQQTGTDGNVTLVDCQGKFLMSYNGEPQELDLSTRTYQVVEQGGDWLVCGVR